MDDFSAEDLGKIIGIAGVLVSLGVLPAKYKATIGTASLLLTLWGFLSD